MRTIKTWLIAIAALLCSITASAHDFEVDGIYYNIISHSDLTVEVTYKGSDEYSYSNEYTGEVIIPTTIVHDENTYDVIGIGKRTFYNCGEMTMIEIPQSVTYIGEQAFYCCYSLTSITIPKNIKTIEHDTFRKCSGLTSIEIPEGVKSIGFYAFADCIRLTSVNIPKSVTSIGNNAFDNTGWYNDSYDGILYLDDWLICNKGKSLTRLNIPEGTRGIADNAFLDSQNSLSSVTIPGSVISIGERAFSGCSKLTSIVIPEGVAMIKERAFYNCSNLVSITFPESIEYVGKEAFEGTMWDKNLGGGSIYIGKYYYKFKGTMPNNASIIIAEGTKGIGENAFSGYVNLRNVTIPESVTSIGNAAFSGCTNLASVYIPEGIESIGNSTFQGCSNLTSIILPSGMTNIGGYAFEKCSGLTSITIPEGVVSIGAFAFSGCVNLASANIPIGLNAIENGVFQHCKKLSSIDIPFGTKAIGQWAFQNCNGLTSITIPENVMVIGDYAFSGCNNLHTVINNSNINLAEYAIGLTAERIFNGKELTRKDDFLFQSIDNEYRLVQYVGNDEAVVLPNNYDGEGYIIDDYALFEHKLHSLVVGEGVLSIGKNVLKETPNKVIWLTNTPPTNYARIEGNINYTANDQYLNLSNVEVYPYLSSLFEVDGVRFVPVSPSERTCHAIDCAYDSTVTFVHIGETTSFKGVEMKVTRVNSRTFYNNNYIKKVTLSHQGDIDSLAFYNCTAIKNLSLSNRGNIGSKSFCGCFSIESMIISNLGSIESQAFYECEGLKVLNVSNNGDIGAEAFYGCGKIDTAIISNQGDIERLAFYKFGDAKYLNITNIGDINDMAFRNCGKIDTLYILSHGNIGNEAFYASGIMNAIISNIGSIGDEAFEGCTILSSAVLGDSIRSLGVDAFRGCGELKEIYIPSSVKTIGESCFYDCISLESAELGNGINILNNNTFYQCKKLGKIVIPDVVETIGEYCFYGCSTLTHAEIGDNVKTIKYNAFQNCTSLSEIRIPESTTEIDSYTFGGCRQLSDVVIEDRVTTLALGSNGSSPLFADCPLDSVYIGGKITYNTSSEKGYSPFYRNTSLRTVVITDKEEQIYENEFYGCTNLKNVAIGNGVKSIGNYAFSGCSNLDGFSFGSNLEEIGTEAFSDCTNLTTITSHAAVPPTCGNQALDDINKWSCVLKVPQSYAAAYQAADQWKEFFFIEDVVEVKKYALTYMVDGKVYYTDSLAHKVTLTAIEEPVKEGYTFSGWDKVLATMPAEDVVINGTFTINTYKVEYVVDGETYRTDEVAYNDTLILVEEPTKEGHTFSGWSEAPETMPANDITISGTFTVNSYLLTYTVDGETVQTDSVAYGTAITLLDEPTKEGHTFSGWSEAPETMPASDVLISGAFTVNKYLVTFKIGDEVIAADSLEYGTTIVAPEAPEKEGYTFDGWGEVAETVPAGNVTYEGTYTVNIYKVYYYVGEELVHTAEVAYGEAIPEYVYEPTEAGYTFLGWIGDTYETMPAHDVTYTANIDDAIEQLTIDNSQLTIYDLSGRKVLDTENLKGGIYIVNGRKVIVK